MPHSGELNHSKGENIENIHRLARDENDINYKSKNRFASKKVALSG